MIRRLIKLIVTAIVVEIVAVLILVMAVALFGPDNATAAEQWAIDVGMWLGPLAGFLLCLIGGRYVANGAAIGRVLWGFFLGVAVAAIDVSLLSASGEVIAGVFLYSNIGRVVAGTIGGALARGPVK